jgi:hypothetical protein
MPDITQLPQIRSNETDAAPNTHPGVSSPRCVWGENGYRSSEDQISFGRWRFGFFIFYGVTVLLLGGLAISTDRPATFASTTAPAHSAIVDR